MEELAVYSQYEPWGSVGDDERLRYLLAELANKVGGGRRVAKDKYVTYRPDEFPIRSFRRAKRRQVVRRMSEQESNRQVEAALASVGLHFSGTWTPPEG